MVRTCTCPKKCALPSIPVRDCAYLAGLIDGEGCIGIDRMKKQEIYRTFRPTLVIGSTTPVLIDWCWERFPIGSRSIQKRMQGAKWRSLHKVVWTYHGAFHVLRAVRPYLVLKGAQADLLLHMPFAPRANKRFGMTEKIRAGQVAAWEQLRELKHGATS